MIATLVAERIEQQREAPVQRTPGSRWRRMLLWGLLTGAFGYLYAAILADLVADWWQDPDYSHGFLVPVLSAYFVWQRRQQLTSIPLQPHWGGFCVLLLGLIVLFLGHLGAELFLMRISMIMVITGVVVYVLGWPCLRLVTFPIVFLLFMIPPPALVLHLLTFPLQLLAAKVSTFSLQLLHLPVYREGNVIFLPYVTLEVVEACSGLRSLVSLLALAVVFAYLTQRHPWKRTLLVVSAVPIALVANACRIWGTGVLAHLYGSKVAEGFYHAFAGWSVFVVALVLLMLEGFVLSRLPLQRRRRQEDRL
jgi:exosortase